MSFDGYKTSTSWGDNMLECWLLQHLGQSIVLYPMPHVMMMLTLTTNVFNPVLPPKPSNLLFPSNKSDLNLL